MWGRQEPLASLTSGRRFQARHTHTSPLLHKLACLCCHRNIRVIVVDQDCLDYLRPVNVCGPGGLSRLSLVFDNAYA